ncbi:MAG: hypothetical protein JW919_03595 [Candidatus Omnitrophica bacterium]|nr:hypothetical protein [Candidatus Omnitrophota bacterium]
MDDLGTYLKAKETDLEDICTRCGACCGAYDEDPCAHLKKGANGLTYCDIYPVRLGKRKTVSGREFECVPISQVLAEGWPKDERCAYFLRKMGRTY